MCIGKLIWQLIGYLKLANLSSILWSFETFHHHRSLVLLCRQIELDGCLNLNLA